MAHAAHPTVAPRRRPTQARAQARVTRILEATRRLVENGPLEGVTTTRIAAEAGLPIGSLYQYFPNREAVLAELARELVAETDAAALAAIAASHRKPLPDAVAEAVDRILAAHQRQLRSAALLRAVYATPACRGVVDDSNLRIAAALAEHPALAGSDDAGASFRRALVTVTAAEAVQQLALAAPDPAEAQAVAHELKCLLTAYLTLHRDDEERASDVDASSIPTPTR